MQEKGLEELATEVAKDLGLSIRGFRLGRIDSSGDQGMTIHCSWSTPYRIELAVRLRGNESSDEIKAEVLRQLKPLLRDLPGTQSKGKSVRVLLVEDDVLFVKILSASLAAFDVIVDAVLNAERAVDLLREKRFDALVTDLHLGQMSGVDLVEYVLAESLIDTSRILVLTGERDGRQIQWARLPGVRVLHKPVTATDLNTALRTIVAIRNG